MVVAKRGYYFECAFGDEPMMILRRVNYVQK